MAFSSIYEIGHESLKKRLSLSTYCHCSYRLPSVMYVIVTSQSFESQVVLMNHLLVVWYQVCWCGAGWAQSKRTNDETNVGKKKGKLNSNNNNKRGKSCRTRGWRVPFFSSHLICIYDHRLYRHYYKGVAQRKFCFFGLMFLLLP